MRKAIVLTLIATSLYGNYYPETPTSPSMGIYGTNSLGVTEVDILSPSGRTSGNLYQNIDGTRSGTINNYNTGTRTNVLIDSYGNVDTINRTSF